MAAGISKRQQARNERALQELIKLVPGNERCADCQSRNPGWASWNLGIFLCMRCASIHRKLGVHISKVKSLSMDSWTNDQVEHMRRIGNTSSNNELNPKAIRPTLPLDVDEINIAMEKFIRQKYEQKLFKRGVHRRNVPSVDSDDKPPTPPPKPIQSLGHRSSSAPIRPNERRLPSTPYQETPYRLLQTQSMDKASRVFGAAVGGTPPQPIDEFRTKLPSLRGMGFTDDARSLAILKATGGDMSKTVEALVNLGHGPDAVSPPKSEPKSLASTNPFEQITPSKPPHNPWQQPSAAENFFAQSPPPQQLNVSQPLFPNLTGGYPAQQQMQLPYQHPLTPPVPQVQHQLVVTPTIEANPFLQQTNPYLNSSPVIPSSADMFFANPSNPYSAVSPGQDYWSQQLQQQQQQQQHQQHQQHQQQQQPIFQPPRIDKTSIMALYNYPQLAPQRPEESNNAPIGQSPEPGQPNTAPGSKNPFAGSQKMLASEKPAAATVGSHMTQESIDFGGWQNGRHSPDAFANLSARS